MTVLRTVGVCFARFIHWILNQVQDDDLFEIVVERPLGLNPYIGAACAALPTTLSLKVGISARLAYLYAARPCGLALGAIRLRRAALKILRNTLANPIRQFKFACRTLQ